MACLQGCSSLMPIIMVLVSLAETTSRNRFGNYNVERSDPVAASSCDFEDGICGWTQMKEQDDFDWVIFGHRQTGDNTGPMFDHTSGVGRYYLLMNATGRDEGDAALLVSPEFTATSGRCMNFYYHMYGSTMGRLTIYLLTGGAEGGELMVFGRDGDQGRGMVHEALGWHPGRINIHSPIPYRILIKAIVGSAEQSYIGLDDITLTDAVCPNIPESCGVSSPVERSRRIVNGEHSLAGQWPWQVLIHIHNNKTDGYSQCGGTLISPQYVLTAAHCVEDRSNDEFISDVESVRMSFQMHQAEWEPQEFSLHPQAMYVHEDRAVSTIGIGPHDLLLLKLPYALTLDENVNVACLPGASSTVSVGTQCVVSGFGREHYTGVSSWELQHAYVDILRHSLCSNYHGEHRVKEDNICAGSNTDVAIDACAGDSGGPLVCEEDGHYVLRGVVSFGSKCGFRVYPTPGVYVDVAYYRHWIDKHIQE